MLNTIALWDKPRPSNERDGEGRLVEKAGIRKDWMRTRSDFCYRDNAFQAFASLLEAVDCRTVALSYSSEGIVPIEELQELMERQGRVTLFTNDYVKYRGGRQSPTRRIHNLEMVLVLDRRSAGNASEGARVRRFLLEKKLMALLGQVYYPSLIRKRFRTREDNWLHWAGGRLRMPRLFRFELNEFDLDMIEGVFRQAETEALEALHYDLSSCLCTDRRDEMDLQLSLLTSAADESERRAILKTVLWLLKKFAFKKYRKLFVAASERVRSAAAGYPEIQAALGDLCELAWRRFEG
jgi:adenine-specific DNA-methyltransferase